MPPNPIVFDRPLLRRRRERARALGPETFLIDRVAVELAERLGAVLRQFELAVDLGTPTDAVRGALAGNASIGRLLAASPLPNGSTLRIANVRRARATGQTQSRARTSVYAPGPTTTAARRSAKHSRSALFVEQHPTFARSFDVRTNG